MAKRQKKTTRTRKPCDPFSRLTWEDLEDWAGHRIVARGHSYQRGNAVQGPAHTADGVLLAWVEGSRRYATRVGIRGRKQLESEHAAPAERMVSSRAARWRWIVLRVSWPGPEPPPPPAPSPPLSQGRTDQRWPPRRRHPWDLGNVAGALMFD